MYKSRFRKLTTVKLPQFSGTRVLMLPFRMDDLDSVPDDLAHYKDTIESLVAISPTGDHLQRENQVGYLTIDEKVVKKGDTLRLKGLHIDGLGTDDRYDMSIWAISGVKRYVEGMWDEEKKEWRKRDSKSKWYHSAAGIGGMITVSNPAGCRAWNHRAFEGTIGKNGDCEHLREQFPEDESTIFEPNVAYWCNSSCVHESLPMETTQERTFVRLSMPSDAPWFRGYTRNPKGIEPTGPVVSAGFHRPGEPEVVLNA